MNVQKRSEKLKQIIKRKQLDLEKNFNQRLIWGLLLILGLSSAAFFPQWHLGLPSLLLFGIPFFYHLRRTKVFKTQIKQFQQLQKFYHRQHLRMQGTFQNEKYAKATENSLSDDLDLVGPKSLFSFLDETLLLNSRQQLLQLLLEGDCEEAILKRQERTKAWQRLWPQFVKWMARTTALIPDKERDLFQHTPLFEEFLKKVANLNMSGPFLLHISLWVSFAMFVVGFLVYLFLLTPLAFTILAVAWLLFFLLSMYSLSYNGKAFHYALELETHIPFQEAYFYGMYEIAKRHDLYPLSKDILKLGSQHYFQKILSLSSYLSLQSHPILLLIINAILPWNHFFAGRLQKTVMNLNNIYGDMKNAMADIEVQISLVFFYLFQTKTFPTFSKEICLDMQKGYHPLIPRHQVKKNDICISSKSPVVLITGSNMSGKTTFLRTIGINHVLSLMGATVFADSFQTFLGKVYSCVRVSDSVQRGDSYFYTEVLRIKDLLSHVKKHPSLFLIDEIFKGTNSRERIIGSSALIQTLCASGSLGLITTHDLELTKGVPGLDNCHFTDHTDGNHLIFDYEIKKGPATSTNALKIMKSVGLPTD